MVEAVPVDPEQRQAQRIHQQIIPPELPPALRQARRQNQTDRRNNADLVRVALAIPAAC
jgi:hypothetical protein